MIDAGPEAVSQRMAGSFRDPSGYVFRRAGNVYRAVDRACHDILREMEANGLLDRLTKQRLVVGTRFVEDPGLRDALATEHPRYEQFLEHDVIAPITYPYEWSVSMLADAALHTLELQRQLLAAGLSLKDATAYNIQFSGGRPVFIDLSSVERPARLDVWFALGQFAQMFTFPLLLVYYHGWDLRSYFLGSLNGRDLEQVARSFGRLGRWLPRAILDVGLPLVLHRSANKRPGGGRAVLEKPSKDPRPQLLNLGRLGAKVRKLAAAYKPGGAWADYAATCIYDEQAEQAKKALIRRFLEEARPARVLDAGCNTGDYSLLAAECGASVLAIDADHDAVELLYRRLKATPARVLPVVVDLCNPSPAIGFRNRERASFLDRVNVDCVLALALLHHLLVSGNLSLPDVRDLFYDMTGEWLVVEFVPPQDPMFQRLMKFRVDLFGGLSLEACRDVFCQRFTLAREEPIPHTQRSLLFLRKRDAEGPGRPGGAL